MRGKSEALYWNALDRQGLRVGLGLSWIASSQRDRSLVCVWVCVCVCGQ